jgi:hypothetical protein
MASGEVAMRFKATQGGRVEPPNDAAPMEQPSHFEARCRRCRHRWQEIHDTRVTQGIGHLAMCPRCFARAVDRKPL